MNFLTRGEDFWVGRITFPLTNYLLNRKNILRNYKKLLKSERYPPELLNEIQLQKIKKIIQYAGRWCPFYTKRFREIGLVPGDIKSLDDVKLIPPLSRCELREHHREIVDLRSQASISIAELSRRRLGDPPVFARFRKHKLVKNNSSGSTGSPTTFYEDGSITAYNWAHELRLKHWYGYHPGTREARMVRLSTEYMAKSRSLRMRKRLWHQLVLPGMNLTVEDYDLCLSNIKSFRPKILLGITTALTGLAGYIRDNQIDISRFRPGFLISWAAPLYDYEDKILKEVFGCPVTNIYGSREVGHIAALCPEGILHINQETHYTEIEDGTSPDSISDAGEILVTTLIPTPMPFIRYRLGDIGEMAHLECACGRTLQVFKKVLGRSGEIFITGNGRMIPPNFWDFTFIDDRFGKAVNRFQVIYTRAGNIRLIIEKSRDYTEKFEEDIKKHLAKNLHRDIQCEFQYVAHIEPQASGKFQMIINEAQF